jgi:hypothetical protein
VSHHFVADRPIGAVPGAVTTAPFRTRWHPATRSAEGDTGHPARLDRTVEHVTIAGIEGTGTWTVVKHDRRVSSDLDCPEPGPQVSAAMEAKPAEDRQPRPPGAALGASAHPSWRSSSDRSGAAPLEPIRRGGVT